MDDALCLPTMPDAFLAWEGQEGQRWEFDGHRPVAMAGVTAGHLTIRQNLIGALAGRLHGQPCWAYGNGQAVEAAGRIRRPDVIVARVPAPPGGAVGNPLIIFEIVNSDTQRLALTAKNAEYRTVPSILRYVVLQQACAAVVAFVRHGEEWDAELSYDTDAALLLPEIGVDLPLGELYAGIALPGADGSNYEPRLTRANGPAAGRTQPIARAAAKGWLRRRLSATRPRGPA